MSICSFIDIYTCACESGAWFHPMKIAIGHHGPLLQEISAVARQQVWLVAARHVHGRGLEQGSPCFDLARKAWQQLVNEDNAAAVRALDIVVCGGAWGRFPTRTCRWRGIGTGVQESQHLAEVKAKDPELRHASPPQGNTLNEWLATHVAAAGQVLDRHRTNQKFPYIRARRSRRSLPIL